MIFNTDFYKGKKVFVTGHTGFKGTWMCMVLKEAGAEITGYSLEPPTDPSLFSLTGIEKDIHSVIGDIRDIDLLKRTLDESAPEIVIHMAAQPLVREGYRSPLYTYQTNVMGTLNLLESVRNSSVGSLLNVTTDKVYLNREWEWSYRENDELDGFDPYSNSKSCSELVTQCYKRSFFAQSDTAVSTARAGNVIGGGDFAENRIIPDCVRAAVRRQPVSLRNPGAVRPYQHVLEPVMAYLMIAAMQLEDRSYEGSYNIGPDDGGCTTLYVAEKFGELWGEGFECKTESCGGPHEANHLQLDCSRIKRTFGWKPVWNIGEALSKVVEWTKCWVENGDIKLCMQRQIYEFLEKWG